MNRRGGDSVVLLSDTAGAAANADIGGKARSLQQLVQRQFPVPSACCVPTSVYAQCVAPILAREPFATWIHATASRDAAADVEVLRALRAAISELSFPNEVRTALAEFLDGLAAGQPVAVRSSGTAEDQPHESFAGLHDTYLNVEGVDAVVAAICNCWASMWSDRAFAYRCDRGVGHEALGMAVVVQRMVAADAAGVAFTADPVLGDRSFTVIEACHGLGEALVSGRVTPDQFRVLKSSGRVVSSVVADSAAGAAVTVDQAAAVAQLAGQVEREVGGTPQDIEWACAGGELFLLQARPITTLPQPPQQVQVWSNVNAGEVLPDVVTPATEGMLDFVDRMIRRILQRVGLELGELPLIGIHGGRAYFNVNTLVGMLHVCPVGRFIDLQEILGGENVGGDGDIPFQLARDQIAPVRGGWWRLLRALPGLCLWLWRLQPGRAAAVVPQLAEQRQRRRAAGAGPRDLRQQVADVDALLGELLVDDGLAAAGVGVSYFDALDRLCKRWFRDEAGLQANSLLAGLGNVSSAEAGLALWRLAKIAAEAPEVCDVLTADGDFASVATALREVAGGAAFLEQWREFLLEHGHHARGEIELAKPRWADQPEYLLSMVRSYLQMMPGKDLIAEYQERRRRAEDGVGECRRRLWLPQRWLFDFVLRRARQGSQLRENLKSEVIRHVALAREWLLAIGAALTERGALETADDVFFLRIDELNDAVKAPAAALDKVVSRKRLDAEYRNSAPPATLFGEWSSALQTATRQRPDGDEWRGIAVSPGIVIGPARVIRGVTHEEQVLPGEILVAPYTDPGWTPYFLPAAGIVVDMGGLLSHGSIVAREYGIPAVVNVGPASQHLQTGTLLEVNGNQGTVKILPPNRG
ncbi:MAG: PEP/pyruvate-binding domain-containing protein [Planctomycetota bacterium]